MHPATQIYHGRPEYHAAYTAGPVPGPRGLSWNPAMHPWGYDMSAYQGYPPSSDGSPSQRSPPYHITSPTEPNSGTPHNIRDILGGQDSTTLPSEIAKTGIAGYQKSPTSTTAPHGGMFGPEHAMIMRSPTTPTAPVGMPYSSEVPSSFYMPAIGPRHIPGKYWPSRTIPTRYAYLQRG